MRCPRCQLENPQDTKFCGNCGASLAGPEATPASSTDTIEASPLRTLEPGTTFARRYQVIEDLGHGGMGRVYKVFDTEVREKLALKLLNPEIATDEETIGRFRNELKLARTVSHRNICRMHDLGREEGAYYITMEYVPGEDLKSFIHRIGALPVGKAVSIARQVCEGLAEAHRVGVVHRDLKPQNVMIDRDGNARIMDFGIARSVKTKGTTGANVIIGTPEYMSPEQVDGKEADRRSDIYSLGVVLFEMLTGRLPFEGETPLATAVKQKSEPAPDPRKINPQIPEDLKRIVWKCLEKSREKRYETADGLLSDLDGIEKSVPAATTPLPLRRPLTSKQITVRLPSRKVWIPAVAGLAAVLAFIVWQFVPERQSGKRAVAVLGFQNQTGDGSFDYLRETIPNLLITSLEQSGHFRVTSWQQLKDLLRKAGRSEGAVLDENAGFEVCREAGVEAIVVGFYTKAGETFVTDAKVLDAATRQPLRAAQSRGEGPASILGTQIDEISRSISKGIGLPVLKIEKPQPKIAELTTNSMDAYNYFLRGREDYEKFYYADSRKYLEKAVALDPTFAVAYLYLYRAANNLLDFRAGEEALEKAEKYSEKATEKERLYIGASYASAIERNPDRQFRLLSELAEKYPREKYAHTELAAYLNGRDRFQEAEEEYEKALALDPNFGFALNQSAYLQAQMGDFGQAIQYLERYAAVNPGDANPLDSIAEMYLLQGRLDTAARKYKEVLDLKPEFHVSCRGLAYVYALQENYPEAGRWVEEHIARAPTQTAKVGGLWLRAFLRYLLGRWDQSLADYLEIRKRSEEAGADYLVLTVDWVTGFIYGDMGEYDLARRAFESHITTGAERNPSYRTSYAASRAYYRGLIDLKQGRLEAARASLREMKALLPGVDPGEKEQLTFLMQLHEAEIALAGDSADAAIAAGRGVKMLNLQNTNPATIAGYNVPFLKDVLARAYWKKGELDQAAAEYEKMMIIHPGDRVRYLIHPLYHYRLGRVLEEKGDRERARLEYGKFLEYWKDADADHPELADARKRLSALR
ncbi:MAG: protein kinase [Acidobacteriota bacterium]|nr:protein kinase [Acidobacteriota bacterium]